MQLRCSTSTISYIAGVHLPGLALTLGALLPVVACGSQPAPPPSAAPPVAAKSAVRTPSSTKPHQEIIEVIETCSKRVADLGALGGGILPRAEVRKTLRVAQPKFDDCLNKANARGAQLHGTLAFAFVVGGGGKVVSAWADEETSTVTDPAFTCCVVRAVERVVFPEPSGGTVVGRYSLNLRNESVASRETPMPSGT